MTEAQQDTSVTPYKFIIRVGHNGDRILRMKFSGKLSPPIPNTDTRENGPNRNFCKNW